MVNTVQSVVSDFGIRTLLNLGLARAAGNEHHGCEYR
jgi:hypothetical protein